MLPLCETPSIDGTVRSYGDHGPRYGAYRQTLAGKLEERLPACYILAPKMLNRAEDRAALAINQHRLTSGAPRVCLRCRCCCFGLGGECVALCGLCPFA